MRRFFFEILRTLLVLFTGHGYDRSARINNFHHKLSFRLHKLLPLFGITGIRKVPVPGTIVGDAPSRYMYVRAEDGGVAHQLIMYHAYEPFESKLVKEHLKPGLTVYNIGANLGYYSILASECVGPQGKVYAFEPAPENFELLQRTVAENRISNIELIQAAVGAAVGSAVLSISSTNSGDHQLQNIASREHVVVNVLSIDSFISEGHRKPDAIIMDVQGSELDALRGGTELLASKHPLVIFTEFWPSGLDQRHPNGAKEMLEILERASFRMSTIDEKHRSVTQTSQRQLLDQFSGNAEANLRCVR